MTLAREKIVKEFIDQRPDTYIGSVQLGMPAIQPFRLEQRNDDLLHLDDLRLERLGILFVVAELGTVHVQTGRFADRDVVVVSGEDLDRFDALKLQGVAEHRDHPGELLLGLPDQQLQLLAAGFDVQCRQHAVLLGES